MNFELSKLLENNKSNLSAKLYQLVQREVAESKKVSIRELKNILRACVDAFIDEATAASAQNVNAFCQYFVKIANGYSLSQGAILQVFVFCQSVIRQSVVEAALKDQVGAVYLREVNAMFDKALNSFLHGATIVFENIKNKQVKLKGASANIEPFSPTFDHCILLRA